MKIYKFKASLNSKEIGSGYPQLWDIDKKYDFSKPDSIHAFKEGDDFFLDSFRCGKAVIEHNNQKGNPAPQLHLNPELTK